MLTVALSVAPLWYYIVLPPSCHLMCKLCVSWAVRGNPSVSGRTVCIERVSAYAFHHFGSTVLVLTLQYICTIYSVAVSILHRTQLLGVTPHGLKRAVLSSRGLVCVCNRRSCQTMDSVRAPWPVRFKCNHHHRSVTPIQWPITAPPAAPCQCILPPCIPHISPCFYTHTDIEAGNLTYTGKSCYNK